MWNPNIQVSGNVVNQLTSSGAISIRQTGGTSRCSDVTLAMTSFSSATRLTQSTKQSVLTTAVKSSVWIKCERGTGKDVIVFSDREIILDPGLRERRNDRQRRGSDKIIPVRHPSQNRTMRVDDRVPNGLRIQ